MSADPSLFMPLSLFSLNLMSGVPSFFNVEEDDALLLRFGTILELVLFGGLNDDELKFID